MPRVGYVDQTQVRWITKFPQQILWHGYRAMAGLGMGIPIDDKDAGHIQRGMLPWQFLARESDWRLMA
jgi:hypothetical protein